MLFEPVMPWLRHDMFAEGVRCVVSRESVAAARQK
jgi:hypothetical protein